VCVCEKGEREREKGRGGYDRSVDATIVVLLKDRGCVNPAGIEAASRKQQLNPPSELQAPGV